MAGGAKGPGGAAGALLPLLLEAGFTRATSQGATRGAAPPNTFTNALLTGDTKSGAGVRSGGEPAAFGNAPSISGLLGGGLRGGLAAGIIGSAVNAATGAVSPIGLGPVGIYEGMVKLGNAIRGWSGEPTLAGNPYGGVPTAQDIQNAFDYGGFFAGAAAQAERSAREASMRETGMLDVGERFGVDVTSGGQGDASTGDTDAGAQGGGGGAGASGGG